MPPKHRTGPTLGLHLRRKTWHLSVSVPTALQVTVGKRRIIESCRTHNRAEAERYAMVRVGEIRTEIANALQEKKTKLNLSSPTAKLDALFVQLEEMRKLVAEGALDAQELQDNLEALEERAVTLRDGRRRDGGATIDLKAVANLKRAFAAVTDPSALPLSKAIDIYLDEIALHTRKQTTAIKRKRLLDLYEWLDDRQAVANDIDRIKAGQYVRHLQSMRRGDKPLAVKTIHDIIGVYVTFWNWLLDRGLTKSNVWERQSRQVRESTRAVKSKVERRPWTQTELIQLLESLEPDDTLRRFTACALTSGMRLNELAHMECDDVKDGYWHVTEGKSKNATRRIPIHPLVLPMVEQLCKDSTNKYVFPDLKPGGIDQKRGHYISKDFGRHIKRLGLSGDGLCFHSLRNTFVTALEASSTPIEVAQYLVGHSRVFTHQVYSGGPSAKQLEHAVKAVSFGRKVDRMLAGK